jgi:hypothetical protein
VTDCVKDLFSVAVQQAKMSLLSVVIVATYFSWRDASDGVDVISGMKMNHEYDVLPPHISQDCILIIVDESPVFNYFAGMPRQKEIIYDSTCWSCQICFIIPTQQSTILL